MADTNNSGSNSSRKIRCPQCGSLTLYSVENPSRPFCGDRCKLIDLGQWADQTYKIPTPANSPDQFEDLDDVDDIESKD